MTITKWFTIIYIYTCLKCKKNISYGKIYNLYKVSPMIISVSNGMQLNVWLVWIENWIFGDSDGRDMFSNGFAYVLSSWICLQTFSRIEHIQKVCLRCGFSCVLVEARVWRILFRKYHIYVRDCGLEYALKEQECWHISCYKYDKI